MSLLSDWSKREVYAQPSGPFTIIKITGSSADTRYEIQVAKNTVTAADLNWLVTAIKAAV